MNQPTNYKTAGFWIRLLVKLIDMSIILLISIILTWLLLEKNPNSNWNFKSPWFFYLYSFLIIFGLIVCFIVVPILFNNQSLGNWLTRTKLISIKNPTIRFNFIERFKLIFKRELFWSISWIFCALLTVILINHSLIIKFALTNKMGLTFSQWETFRVSLVSALASLIVLTQVILSLSILVRKDKRGLHDIYSDTVVVYKKQQTLNSCQLSFNHSTNNINDSIEITFYLNILNNQKNLTSEIEIIDLDNDLNYQY